MRERLVKRDRRAMYILLLLVAGFILMGTRAVSSPVVMEVEVQGAKRTDPSLVMTTSGIRVGTELTIEITQEAIRRIYGLNLFSDVSIEAEEVLGGIRVIITVSELPVLERVIIRGNDKVSTEDIEDKITLVPGMALSGRRIHDARQSIHELYEEKGYLLAEVTASASPPDGEQRSTLTITIAEGKSVKIRDIEIEGNETFSDRTLESQMDNREKEWYRKAKFNREKFKEDLKKIVRYYADHGHPLATVVDTNFTYDESKEWMTINITVEEGPLFTLGEASFEGNAVVSTEDLTSAVTYHPGDLYEENKLDETLNELYGLYTEEGYIYARIVPEQHSVDQAVNIHYLIEEGDPAHIRRIAIEGNTKTLEKVIRRELFLYPGDRFRRSKLVRSQREVFNLNFFSDLQLDSRPAGENGDIDLILRVEEKQTGQIMAGLAYGQYDKLTGYVQLNTPNLFGRGQSSYIRYEGGERKENYEFGFTEPWLFDMPLTAGFDLFHTTHLWEWTETRRGGAVHLSRPLPWIDYTRAYWRYRLEDVDIEFDPEDIDDLPQAVIDQQGLRVTSSMRFALARDTRDNYFNATSGTRIYTSAEYAGGLLQGDVDYQKYTNETRWYGTLFWKVVLMLRAWGGIVDGYTDSSTVPLWERFFLGGVGLTGVRGYPERYIGTEEGGTLIGGRAALIFTTELKVPLAPQMLYGVMFADAGNTWDSPHDIHIKNSASLYRGAGVGIRLDVPMLGVIGFDMGYGFDREEGAQWEQHFQIGTTF